jgi:hypothetical protein
MILGYFQIEIGNSLKSVLEVNFAGYTKRHINSCFKHGEGVSGFSNYGTSSVGKNHFGKNALSKS